MTNIFYQLCSTRDPEERLEDAAMAKALVDVLGDEIELGPPHNTF